MERDFGRSEAELRPVRITTDYLRYPDGSCLIEMGNTKVLCAATLSQRVPQWLSGSGRGWITAEYSLLPASTQERTRRDSSGGRTQEIQRLIGRSLRQAVDLSLLGERTITIDCDVIQADGGTRTASITGGYVALVLALKRLADLKLIPDSGVLKEQIAAVSCGIVNGVPMLDLDYDEDSKANVDINFVMTGAGKYIEIQGTAENGAFDDSELEVLKSLARKGIENLIKIQKEALGEALEILDGSHGEQG